MKNSIKLSAVLVILSAGIFVAAPLATKAAIVPSHDEVAFSSLPSSKGIAVKVSKSDAGKTSIIIYDNDKNVLRKDVISGTKTLEKGYILTNLDNGDYTIEVTSSGKVVKEAIHVYDEGQTKMFIIKG